MINWCIFILNIGNNVKKSREKLTEKFSESNIPDVGVLERFCVGRDSGFCCVLETCPWVRGEEKNTSKRKRKRKEGTTALIRKLPEAHMRTVEKTRMMSGRYEGPPFAPHGPRVESASRQKEPHFHILYN